MSNPALVKAIDFISVSTISYLILGCKSNYHTITTTTTPPLGTALRAYENEEVHEKSMLSSALNF
jgi:hypothetical protein